MSSQSESVESPVGQRIYDVSKLRQAIALEPDCWRPLVLTNGCFDLLHAGHVRYLTVARTLGRSLVVGLNSDSSVRQIKPPVSGQPPRPIVPEVYRAEVLAALRPVDAVVVFEESTAIALIQALRPDIYVKGGDYHMDMLPEVPAVTAYGGKVCLVPLEISLSTTHIVRRILQKA